LVPDVCEFTICGKGPSWTLVVSVISGADEGVLRGVGGRAEAKYSPGVKGFCVVLA